MNLHNWPGTVTQCHSFDILRSAFSFASRTRHWFSSQCLTWPNSVELIQCNHRPQHDEFVENILQHPDRSSEDYFHLDQTIEKRDFLFYHTPPLSSLWLLLQGPPLKHPVSLPSMARLSHWVGQGRSGRNERLYEEFPFLKLGSRWLLIIFHANLHLELHLLVEWSMTTAGGELSLQEEFLD